MSPIPTQEPDPRPRWSPCILPLWRRPDLPPLHSPAARTASPPPDLQKERGKTEEDEEEKRGKSEEDGERERGGCLPSVSTYPARCSLGTTATAPLATTVTT